MSVSSGSVDGLDKIINASRAAREVKRALCVKMVLGAIPVVQICELLNVSQPFVSKWRSIYEAQGARGLGLGYAGSVGYLRDEQRGAVISWIQAQASPHKALSVAAVRDYLQQHHEIVYQSKQSYYELMYELMRAAGMR